jgi:glycosyltransferase involved in cell wall biosynthesis
MDRPLNIFYVLIGLNMGGVQQWVLDLGKRLDRKRFRPVVCAIENTGIIGKEIEAQGIEVITLGYRRQSFRTVRGLAKLMKERQIDILHGVSYHPSLYARLAGLLAGIPVMLTYEPVVYDNRRIQRVLLSRFLDRYTAGYVACSHGVVEQLDAWYGYAPDKIELIYNAVDTEQFKPPLSRAEAKKKLGLDPVRPIVGMVARLDPEKGHRFFFEAIQRLPGHDQVQWLVVGSGRDEAGVKEQAQHFGVADRVQFLGTRRDLPDLLGAFDIYVLPTLKEGFPITTLNAMACGCAVVVSDYPANLEGVSNEVNGLVVPMGDSVLLTQALDRLLSSEAERTELGEAARREVVARFSIDHHVALIEAYYQRMWNARC